MAKYATAVAVWLDVGMPGKKLLFHGHEVAQMA